MALYSLSHNLAQHTTYMHPIIHPAYLPTLTVSHVLVPICAPIPLSPVSCALLLAHSPRHPATLYICRQKQAERPHCRSYPLSQLLAELVQGLSDMQTFVRLNLVRAICSRCSPPFIIRVYSCALGPRSPFTVHILDPSCSSLVPFFVFRHCLRKLKETFNNTRIPLE
ncbi:hypothetical protein K474DRAFT_472511 [Panus rudis PR-1116 ss-1]|nr:hypothetical protein K474DRAFT_472511 [Panus rudis PR-1116 ss-1]